MPTRLTVQNQRSFIAISVAAYVPCVEILRRLRQAMDRRSVYSESQIRRLHNDFR